MHMQNIEERTLMFLTSSEVAAVILQDTTPELGQ